MKAFGSFSISLAVFAGVLVAVLPAGPADSSGGAGGTITGIVDGDTLWIDVDGDGQGPIEVRLNGVNTPEWYACMGSEATARMGELVQVGGRVKLKGDPHGPRDQFGRVHMRVFKGKTELARKLLKEGLGVPMPEQGLKAGVNRRYRTKAHGAQLAGIGIWDPTTCRVGPRQNVPIGLRVMWEADGRDEDNLAGEWIEVHNDGTQTLSLGGWELRDATLKSFIFPNGTELEPGSSIRVTGGDGGGGLRWGNSEPLFSPFGDGAYLFDPDGDIRSYVDFPCLFDCGDPLIGEVSVTVHYDAAGKDVDNVNGEWVDITNVSDATIDLFDYLLYTDGYVYHFDRESKVKAGERMRVKVGHGTDTRLRRYWGKDGPIFRNSGDEVELWGLDGRVIDRFEWPCDPCGPTPNVIFTFVNAKSRFGDQTYPNGEFIDIENRSGGDVALSGWSVKSKLVKYFFPGSFVLRAGRTVRLFVGSGTDSSDSLYWGRTSGILRNTDGSVSLWTPLGDKADCYGWGGARCQPAPNPLPLSISVDYTGSSPNDESFGVRNDSSGPIDLEDFKLVYRGWVLEFPPLVLEGKKTVTVFAGSGADTASEFYWGSTSTIILSQGEVLLYDADGAVVASLTWG